MHAKPHIRLNPHRRARLIAWMLAMLAWVHAVFFQDRIMTRRHLRRRGGALSLDWVARMVTRLILIRAAETLGPRKPRIRHVRERGIDMSRGCLVRSVIGSRLRRAFKHRDVAQRIAILTAALKTLDVWAARFAKRLARRVTKLWAIATRPCAADTLASADILTLRLVDTS